MQRRRIFAIYVAALAADLVTTMIAIRYYGAVEMNPILHGSPILFTITAKATQAAVLGFFLWKKGDSPTVRRGAVASAALAWAIPVFNAFQILKV